MKKCPWILLVVPALFGACGYGGGNADCRHHDGFQCQDGAVYWVDGCGNIEEVKEMCQCGCLADRSGCKTDCSCVPDCTGKVCGDDGCQGLCPPGCPAGQTCNAQGQCVTGDCSPGTTRCGTECVNTNTSTDHCGGCNNACEPGEICENGTCMSQSDCRLTSCPSGYYCDLNTGECVEGCLEDSGCGVGEICVNRACVAGCRQDTDCGTGKICVNGQCRIGCREHADCSPGQICDNLACRAGCLYNSSCNAGYWCDNSVYECVACSDLSYEPNDADANRTQFNAVQNDEGQAWHLSACGDRDVDKIRVSMDYILNHYDITSLIVEVSAAPANSTTKFDVFIEDYDPEFAEFTEHVYEDGWVEIVHLEGGECAGTCTPLHVQIDITTDSSVPVEYTVGAIVQ